MKNKNYMKTYYNVIMPMHNFKGLFGSLCRMVTKHEKNKWEVIFFFFFSVKMLVLLLTFFPPQHILWPKCHCIKNVSLICIMLIAQRQVCLTTQTGRGLLQPWKKWIHLIKKKKERKKIKKEKKIKKKEVANTRMSARNWFHY